MVIFITDKTLQGMIIWWPKLLVFLMISFYSYSSMPDFFLISQVILFNQQSLRLKSDPLVGWWLVFGEKHRTSISIHLLSRVFTLELSPWNHSLLYTNIDRMSITTIKPCKLLWIHDFVEIANHDKIFILWFGFVLGTVTT